jgi:hypothetical protein
MIGLARGAHRHEVPSGGLPRVKRDGAPGPRASRPAGATNDKLNSEGHTP